jgi:hypothetical protein
MPSPNSNPAVPYLQFQQLFDAALEEYSRTTKMNLKTDPLAAKFLDRDCDSSDAVLKILEEQVSEFDKFRKGDRKVQLMRRLKPTVDILIGLSTSDVVVEGISSVRLPRSNYPLRNFIDSSPTL